MHPEIEVVDLLSHPPEITETRLEHGDPIHQAVHGFRLSHDPLLEAERLKRWNQVAAKWNDSAPRLDRGPYPDVARVPPGELDLLE